MDEIITYLETILYYVTMTFISTKLLGASLIKSRYSLSIVFFLPLLICIILFDHNLSLCILELTQIAIILLLRLCCQNIRLYSIFYQYFLLFSICITITSCLKILLDVPTSFEWIWEFIVNLTVLTVCLIICNSKIQIKARLVIQIIKKRIKIIFLFLSFASASLSVLIANDYLYRGIIYWNYTTKLVFVCLMVPIALLLPIVVIYLITIKQVNNQNKYYEKQITAQATYYIHLAESNRKLRSFKHNYKNTNIGLMKLLSEGKNEEALKLLEAQNQELDSTSVQFDTGNGIVDALLTDKQRQAGNINTTITFEGAVPRDSIEAVDLCIIFGNPLDNALEACAEIDVETPKEIHISCACNSGFAFIEITNPVKNKVEIRGNLPETTKPDKEMHGFGLYSLEKVIKKYDGEVTCECDETAFKLSIEFSIPVRD